VSENSPSADVVAVAGRLAERLESRGQEYAFGGALALGYWGVPRGTIDVDLTLYMPAERPSECLWLLQDLGCEFAASDAADSLREHGFCSVRFEGIRLDVFLPTTPFYEAARLRRRRLTLAGRPTMLWDAESLTVFKMMFFRRKDVADVEQMLRTQAGQFDRGWVRDNLVEIYGSRDPRLATWDEMVRDVPLA
jgi:hypothetical protein